MRKLILIGGIMIFLLLLFWGLVFLHEKQTYKIDSFEMSRGQIESIFGSLDEETEVITVCDMEVEGLEGCVLIGRLP